MKRILLLAALLLPGILPVFSAPYALFRFQGDVTVKHSGEGTWNKAARRDTLVPQDVLKIGENAYVMIINIESGQIYKSSGRGEKRVYDIVSSAKAASASVTALSCRELFEELKTDTSKSNDLRVGAVFRGESDMRRLDSLARDCRPDGRVSLTVLEDAGMVHFCLKNLSETPLFVNVVRISSEGKRQVCLEFKPDSECDGLLLPPGVSLELPQYQFVSDGSSFFPFATSFKYDTRALQRRL